MMRPKIEIPREELVDYCRRYHVSRLALFGSVLRIEWIDIIGFRNIAIHAYFKRQLVDRLDIGDPGCA